MGNCKGWLSAYDALIFEIARKHFDVTCRVDQSGGWKENGSCFSESRLKVCDLVGFAQAGRGNGQSPDPFEEGFQVVFLARFGNDQLSTGQIIYAEFVRPFEGEAIAFDA